MGKKANYPGLSELYRRDPDKADKLLFGRETHPDRRGFLKGAGLAIMGAMVGSTIPFHRYIPAHFIPSVLAAERTIRGKDGLVVINERPVNAETPAHLLDDAITPTERHFIRNNGFPPENTDATGWKLTVDGLVDTPITLDIDDLKQRFEVVTRALVLECGGNGRAFFDPPAKGDHWTYGAVGCSEWTGVRLADVLKAVGMKRSVIYTAHEGADTHLSGEPGRLPLSRGVPIEKAMDEHNLIAFAQNGRPIHPMNGAPLRLIIPGMAGVLLAEVADPHLAARPGARRPENDRHLLPGPESPRRPGRGGGRERLQDHTQHARQVVDHESVQRPQDGRPVAGGPRPRVGRRPAGGCRASLDRLRRNVDEHGSGRPGEPVRVAELAGKRRVSAGWGITRSGPGRRTRTVSASRMRSRGTRGAISITPCIGWR